MKEHFKQFHDLDLNKINGVAIMADTDNSKLSSIAYFQNIFFFKLISQFLTFFLIYELINDSITAATTSSSGDAVGYPKFHKITPINQIIKTFI